MVTDMTECYELPVLFTEEERKAYADWGMKKEKALMPFAAATVLIYIVAAVLVGWRVWGIREEDHLWFQILEQSHWIGDITGVLAICMTIVLLGPLNLLLDRIWKKPVDPVRLRVELNDIGVEISQMGGDGNLPWGIPERYSLKEYRAFLNPKDNAVCFHSKWLIIGANTIENIYPKEKQHAWMDYPTGRAGDITSVQRFLDLLEGYEKSFEEKRKEKEWLQKSSGISAEGRTQRFRGN